MRNYNCARYETLQLDLSARFQRPRQRTTHSIHINDQERRWRIRFPKCRRLQSASDIRIEFDTGMRLSDSQHDVTGNRRRLHTELAYVDDRQQLHRPKCRRRNSGEYDHQGQRGGDLCQLDEQRHHVQHTRRTSASGRFAIHGVDVVYFTPDAADRLAK
jgi:hypothetical protein